MWNNVKYRCLHILFVIGEILHSHLNKFFESRRILRCIISKEHITFFYSGEKDAGDKKEKDKKKGV